MVTSLANLLRHHDKLIKFNSLIAPYKLPVSLLPGNPFLAHGLLDGGLGDPVIIEGRDMGGLGIDQGNLGIRDLDGATHAGRIAAAGNRVVFLGLFDRKGRGTYPLLGLPQIKIGLLDIQLNRLA